MASARETRKPRAAKTDERLDEALEETFPASDPIAVGRATGNEPAARPTDRKAPKVDADDLPAPRRRKRR